MSIDKDQKNNLPTAPSWEYPTVLSKLSTEDRELEDRAREAYLDYELAVAWSKRHQTGTSIDNFPQYLQAYEPALYQRWLHRNDAAEAAEKMKLAESYLRKYKTFTPTNFRPVTEEDYINLAAQLQRFEEFQHKALQAGEPVPSLTLETVHAMQLEAQPGSEREKIIKELQDLGLPIKIKEQPEPVKDYELKMTHDHSDSFEMDVDKLKEAIELFNRIADCVHSGGGWYATKDEYQSLCLLLHAAKDYYLYEVDQLG